MEEINDLLQKIGPGRMSNTAYDTAWVARLGEMDPVLSNRAMEWICENQLSDGSWGARDIYYYHDRVICTLASMIALTYRGRRMHDKTQIERGLDALEKITTGATQGLASDPNGATVGFEMITPTLVTEAERLGIIKQQGDRILGRMTQMRAKKIEKLRGLKISKYITPAFSSEMAGIDGMAMFDIDNLQEPNGSVGNSPSATAYFSMLLKPNDSSAINYLHQAIHSNGGVPDFNPIDIFEVSWSLWNLHLIQNLDIDPTLLKTHLDFLENHWDVKSGICTSANGTIKDGDDSALVYDVLARYGRKQDIEAILSYEEAEHFRCFTLESNPSISTNIHILGALREAGFEQKHPSVQKVLNFLRSTQFEDGYFLDKWHASPYYSTSHAIIICQGYDNELCRKAIEWIINNQNADGSWGYYTPTAEETAYAIQSLSIWKRSGNNVPSGIIERGLDWLTQHTNPPYEPLWIGKALYCPELVVRSAIVSAQALAKEG